MTARRAVRLLLAVLPIVLVTEIARAEPLHVRETAVARLLDLDVKPVAIAHRGFGQNLGEDPARPIENTLAAVRRGFRAGAAVMEIDVQLTRDRHVVAYHDDVLADFTCLNRLGLHELHARLPYVPTLVAVLEAARHFPGVLIIELKAAAPLCDPHDTQDHAIVAAVTHLVRHMGMTHRVLLTSFSPALLYRAQRRAPEIERILAISGLQLLTEEQITAALGLTVTFVDKTFGLGLQWAELGNVFRLPGYRSFEEILNTVALTGARVVEADLLLLHSSGAPFVAGLQAAGLKVFGFTANTEDDWDFLEALGVDAIYTNDVPLGVRRQATIP
jgi:glycerophosphoryl diester phosphodiesterase